MIAGAEEPLAEEEPYVQLADLTDEGLGIVLMQCCVDGAVQTVAELLALGRINDVCDQAGIRPLHVACRGDDESVAEALVELLINHGADVNAATLDNEANDTSSPIFWTPLHEACYFGSPGIVRLLLDARADVHARTKNGTTPLEVAIDRIGLDPELLDRPASHNECCELLTAAGAVDWRRQAAGVA